MLKKVLIFCFLIIGTWGVGQTTVTNSYMFDGELREYRVYIPAAYDGTTRVPLVFNLHGYGSNNMQQEAYGDFRDIADTANFIIVHPQGLTDLFGSTHWNCFGTSSVDDVGFLSSLIDTIFENYYIDGDRIYSTGMSNGGFMSYKLACLLSGRIAAIASVTGSITPTEFEDCITNHPMPVMQIHGTDDPTVPYAGNALFMPIEDVVEHWVTFNECNPSPTVTPVPNTDTDDGCTATHYVYNDGLLGSTVEFFKIEDGQHTWPGSDFVTGVTNNDFNASVEIWRFFSQFNLAHLTSSIETNEKPADFEIYPNPSNQENIRLNFADNAEKHIVVHNFLGQVISDQTSTAKTMNLTIRDKGIFLISITQNGQTRTEKLVRN